MQKMEQNAPWWEKENKKKNKKQKPKKPTKQKFPPYNSNPSEGKHTKEA